MAARRVVLRIVLSNTYEFFILLLVLLNTVLLSLNGIVTNSYRVELMESIYKACSYIFIVDMCLKVFGMGIEEYVRDPLNILDGLLSLMSIAVLILEKVQSDESTLIALRVLRIFRVIRMTRMMRNITYLRIILNAMVQIAKRSSFLLAFLIFLNIIYALVGMTIYGGLWSNNVYPNFNNYFNSFMAVFDLMTIENWN